MEHDNGNKYLGLLQSNLVTPMKEDMKKTNAAVARLRLRLMILKIVLVLGICLNAWCGFMEAHPWLWIPYILILLVI